MYSKIYIAFFNLLTTFICWIIFFEHYRDIEPVRFVLPFKPVTCHDLPLSKPMTCHALSRPLSLADPAPVQGATRLGANHMHAPTIPFSRCPTARTRLTYNPYGYRAWIRANPAGPTGAWITGVECCWGVCPTAAAPRLGSCGWWRVAGTQVGTLQAVVTEHKPTLGTSNTSAWVCQFWKNACTTARLRTEHSPALKHHLFCAESLVPVVMLLPHQPKVPCVLDKAAVTANRTGKGVAMLSI